MAMTKTKEALKEAKEIFKENKRKFKKRSFKNAKNRNKASRKAKKRKVDIDFPYVPDRVSHKTSVDNIILTYSLHPEAEKVIWAVKHKKFFREDDHVDMIRYAVHIYQKYGIEPTAKSTNLYDLVNQMIPYKHSRAAIGFSYKSFTHFRVHPQNDFLLGDTTFKEALNNFTESKYNFTFTKKEVATIYNSDRTFDEIFFTTLCKRFDINQCFTNSIRDFTRERINKHILEFISKFETKNDWNIMDYYCFLTASERNELRRKNINNIRGESDLWHDQIRMANNHEYLYWGNYGFEPYSETVRDGGETKIVTIQVVKDTTELRDEGREMKHCVFSYIRSCVTGRSKIFSVTIQDNIHEKPKRISTFELNQNNVLVQHRAKMNASPPPNINKLVKEYVMRIK